MSALGALQAAETSRVAAIRSVRFHRASRRSFGRCSIASSDARSASHLRGARTGDSPTTFHPGRYPAPRRLARPDTTEIRCRGLAVTIITVLAVRDDRSGRWDADPDVMVATTDDTRPSPQIRAHRRCPPLHLHRAPGHEQIGHCANQPRPEAGWREQQNAAELQSAKYGGARHRSGMERLA